jgi:hypothetical protein
VNQILCSAVLLTDAYAKKAMSRSAGVDWHKLPSPCCRYKEPGGISI